MNYPRFVFRCPGPHARAGGTYDQVIVRSEDEAAEMLADGWSETLPAAIEASEAQKIAPPATEQSTDDTRPPTRDEMLAKASELGIAVDGRWGDARLLKEIDQAIAASAQGPI